jgi:O-methyltransferase involved in polyketide biosynthesis
MITEIETTVATCRRINDELVAAIRRGATQYLAIGNRCDFSERQLPTEMRVLSVEQELDSAGEQPVASVLRDAGLSTERITFVSWLGGRISMPQTIVSILRFLGSLPSSSALIFDYMIRRHDDLQHETSMDALASEVGDPPSWHIDPQALRTLLFASGFREIKDISAEGECRRLMLALI